VSVAADPDTPSDEELLARATEAGIHRLAIPTPFQVGRVNAYLIEDSPLTLIDSGPNSGKALDELEQALRARGHAIEEIELLVISHQHIDHFGLASILARRSGAEVAALAGLAPYLRDFSAAAELDDRFAQAIMLRHGVSADVVTALRAVSASFRAWGAAVEVTRLLGDGEELRLRERTLRVLHRPGHSPSDTVFLDEGGSILFAADHLIAHISSNPLLARPLGAPPDFADRSEIGQRPRALVDYIASLERTRAMELSLVLPGHGMPIADHVALIDLRLSMHRRRAERIYGLIAQAPRTAHEIATELWGNVAVTQAYLTISEVLGHVDLLLEEGRVVERAGVEQDVVRFEAT
jgi:glyoxylase-like metal-dependent hydrolase (beta-lactamase superfamily II)